MGAVLFFYPVNGYKAGCRLTFQPFHSSLHCIRFCLISSSMGFLSFPVNHSHIVYGICFAVNKTYLPVNDREHHLFGTACFQQVTDCLFRLSYRSGVSQSGFLMSVWIVFVFLFLVFLNTGRNTENCSENRYTGCFLCPCLFFTLLLSAPACMASHLRERVSNSPLLHFSISRGHSITPPHHLTAKSSRLMIPPALIQTCRNSYQSLF